MSIVDGKGLILWEGGLFVPGSDLLRRCQWAFAAVRAAGGRIIMNEAGRPFGVPGDATVRNASQTASGISTVWFQWGRYLRGETPSAANPNNGALASEHTQGLAIDCNAPTVFDMTLRAKYFAMVGLKQTIASESWHWAIRGPSKVDLTTTAGGGAIPIAPNPTPPPQEDVMAVRAANKKTGNRYLVAPGSIHHLPNDTYMKATDQYGALVVLEEDQFHALTDANGIPWNTIPFIGPGAGWSQTRGLYKESW